MYTKNVALGWRDGLTVEELFERKLEVSQSGANAGVGSSVADGPIKLANLANRCWSLGTLPCCCNKPQRGTKTGARLDVQFRPRSRSRRPEFLGWRPPECDESRLHPNASSQHRRNNNNSQFLTGCAGSSAPCTVRQAQAAEGAIPTTTLT